MSKPAIRAAIRIPTAPTSRGAATEAADASSNVAESHIASESSRIAADAPFQAARDGAIARAIAENRFWIRCRCRNGCCLIGWSRFMGFGRRGLLREDRVECNGSIESTSRDVKYFASDRVILETSSGKHYSHQYIVQWRGSLCILKPPPAILVMRGVFISQRPFLAAR